MPARRSARVSGPRTKYTEDPFAVAGVFSEEDSDGERSPKGKGKQRAVDPPDNSESDDEFAAPQNDAEEEHEEFADDDGDGDGDDDGDDASSAGESAGPSSDIAMDDAGEQEEQSHRTARKRPKRKDPKKWHEPKAMKDEDLVHTRGIHIPLTRSGRNASLQTNFGLDQKDLLAIVYARDRWFRGVDSTLPSRRSLNEAGRFPDYGYGTVLGADPDDAKRERTHGWDWYYDADVGGRFRKKQLLEKVGEDEARRTYMPQSQGKHTVLVGPADGQKAVELAQNETFDFGEVWGERISRKADARTSEGTDAKPESAGKRKTREGWIINFGQKVQALGWAPNQPGLTQYLAVVAPITEEQKANYPDLPEVKAAPAFRPSAPYPTALQLWAFKAKRDNSLTKTIDMDFKPRLRLALCADWGDLRRIAWCPMARDSREEDDEDVLRNIGLLAGVWTDGVVRVIDVRITRSADDTEFYKVQSPVFEAKPPSTVCTCLTWLSPSDVAVGCADGFVAIWNIARTQSSANPLPYFYQRIHSTYILSIAAAYPASPHLLGTTSMDGETRLSSILHPQADVTETPRMRMGSPHIVFSPILQSFLSGEENDFMRLLVTRRFFTTTSVARIPSAVSALATPSAWHPTVMMGCTSGAVLATNPLHRLLSSKAKQLQMAWFTHEWVPRAVGSGVSRFVDGFKAEQTVLGRSQGTDRRLASGHSMATVFEEGTHVTALSWNPNQSCAGWACAGMGCGLVRVEDVAV